jgi:hypothetical protein
MTIGKRSLLGDKRKCPRELGREVLNEFAVL